MDRSRFRKLFAAGGAVAVAGLALALAGQSIGSGPADDAGPGTCAEFARDVDPQTEEVDTGYDSEKDVVYAHADDRTYVLRPSDPGCSALSNSRRVMDDAVRTGRENEDRGCREIARSLQEERTQVRGRPFDRGAAGRYVADRCGGAR